MLWIASRMYCSEGGAHLTHLHCNPPGASLDQLASAKTFVAAGRDAALWSGQLQRTLTTSRRTGGGHS